MRKNKIEIKIISIVLLMLTILLTVSFNVSALVLFSVRDNADIFSVQEESNLTDKLRNFSYKSNWVAVIYTNNEGKNEDNIKDFANNFYAENYGKDRAGFIFTVDMEGKCFDFRTKGSAMYYFDDNRIDDLLDEVEKLMRNGEYYEASDYLIDYVDDCYKQGPPENGTYNNMDLEEDTTPTRDYTIQPDKEQFTNPVKYIGKSFDDITQTFGDDYAEIDEQDSGLTKFICYPRTGNPLQFGIDYNTNAISCIYVYSSDEMTVTLFDDITNNSTLSDIENSSSPYSYTKRVYFNALDNRTEQEITYKTNDGIEYVFTWTDSDFDNDPCYRILIHQGEVPNTKVTQITTTTPETEPVITEPSTSVSVIETTASEGDKPNTDNGFLQTGVIQIASVVILVIVAVGLVVFFWYKKKIN